MFRRRLHITITILSLAVLGVRLHFVIIVCIHQCAAHRRHPSPIPPDTRYCTLLGQHICYRQFEAVHGDICWPSRLQPYHKYNLQ